MPVRPGRRWPRALLSALTFSLVGAMLTVLPWLPDWGQNYFSGGSREWYRLWMNPYFRGTVSGIGVVNLCISFLEIYGMLRGLRRRTPAGSVFAEPPRSE